MATKHGIHVLNAILRSSRAPSSLATSLLRPYPSLPRTLQPAQLARRYAHSIPKPSRSQIAALENESDTKPRKLLEPHYELTFTCVPCGSRSSHTVSKQGYHKGSVLITCQSCRNRHVISDQLNIFGDRKLTVEDLMKEKGQLVKRGTLGEDGDVEFWEDGTTTERGGTAAGKVDELKALDDGESASTIREARDPLSPSGQPTASSPPLAGAGTRPIVDNTFPNDAPSTRRQYHATTRESSTPKEPTKPRFHIPERIRRNARSDYIGAANSALKGVQLNNTVAAESSNAAASESRPPDKAVVEQHELDYLRRSMRGIPGGVRERSLPKERETHQERAHSEITMFRRIMINNMIPKVGVRPPPVERHKPETEAWEKVHAQRAEENAESKMRYIPDHGSTLSRAPALDGNFQITKYKMPAKNPTAWTPTSSKAHNPPSSFQEGDDGRWASSLTEMSTWIHNAVSNLKPIMTKLPVKPESKAREATGSISQSKDNSKSRLFLKREKGEDMFGISWKNDTKSARVIDFDEKLPPVAPAASVVPVGSRMRFVKVGKKFKAIRYIEKDAPEGPVFTRPLSSPDTAITLGAEYNEISDLGPHRRLAPSELQDTRGRKVRPRKAKAPWDASVPATMPSRLRKLIKEPKRFIYAWPKGAMVPVKVQVQPVGRLTSREKAHRYRLSKRPSEKEWEKLSSNVPSKGVDDSVLSPEGFKKEIALATIEGQDGKS